MMLSDALPRRAHVAEVGLEHLVAAALSRAGRVTPRTIERLRA